MSRPNKGGWDFIEVGNLYQYKECGVIWIVEVTADNSTDDMYSFTLTPIACSNDYPDEFSISHTKNLDGVYNNMPQLYEDCEYIMMPIGTDWPFVYDREKLEGSKFDLLNWGNSDGLPCT